jgi:hypothetical protein
MTHVQPILLIKDTWHRHYHDTPAAILLLIVHYEMIINVNIVFMSHLQFILLNGAALVPVVPFEQVGIQPRRRAAGPRGACPAAAGACQCAAADLWADAAVLLI